MSTPINIIGGTDIGSAQVAAAADSAWTALTVAGGDFVSTVTGAAVETGVISQVVALNRDESAGVWIALRSMTDEALSASVGACYIPAAGSLELNVEGMGVTAVSVASETEGAVVSLVAFFMPR